MPHFNIATNDLPPITCAPELDDFNVMTVLRTDLDRWIGIDESAGEGISRENISRFLPWPPRRGRELLATKDSVIEAQAKGVLGGRDGVV